MDPTKKRKLDNNGVLAADFDGGVNNLTIEDARKIIEPFTHGQLLEIVQTAVIRYPDILDAVRSIADRDVTQRKLFIRGLGWETTTEKLRALFSAYGELDEAVVILDKATGKSKGYGFITFRHVDGALLALKEPSKKIDGRMTVTQLAAAGISGGPVGSSNPVDVTLRKIYVANVPYDMPADRLLAHFLSYGEIEEGPLGFDKATGKSKGFTLFVYKTAEAARASLVDPIKNIDGHQLNCKLAIDGKKGKPGAVGPGGGVQGLTGLPAADGQNDGLGSRSSSAIPGSLYGGPGPGDLSAYGSFPGGLQGPTPPSHNPLGVGGPVGSQLPSSLGGASGVYGSGIGGPYGSTSHFGGPGSAGYGGLGSAGGGLGSAGSGMGGTGGGLSGSGAGRGSSLFSVPPSSISGDFPQSAHYSLSSSGYQGQHNQVASTSPAPRGMYQGMPPYY